MATTLEIAAPTRSIWTDVPDLPSFPPLDRDLEVDIAVIGAGITGLTAATLLARAGREVAVIEARPFGLHGVTHRTTAHLTAMLDESDATLERRFGFEGLRHAIDASVQAIDLIERLSNELSIDCDFQRVTGWRYAESGNDVAQIDRDAEVARSHGLRISLDRDPQLPFRVAGAMAIENQAQFHPLKYLAGLSRHLEASHGSIYCDSPVESIEKGSIRHELRTRNGRRIRAHHVVLATHSPPGVWLTLHTRLVPYRSYCLVARIATPLASGLYWDTMDPYHYIRRFDPDDGRLIIVGGEDHKTGHVRETDERFAALERYTRDRFDVQEITHHWSAEWFEPADGLPYIGVVPGNERLYVATGYSGTGMTYGTAAAMLISDLILSRDNPWAKTFSPARIKPLASAPRIAQEAAATIKGLADRFIRVRKADLESIPPGDGRVISHDGHALAVCRDDDGALHACSATCPHLGCIVEWNSAERTWDCPCHGSVFDSQGQVIFGPAMQGLKPHSLEDDDDA